MDRLHCALYIITDRLLALLMTVRSIPFHLAASHLRHELMDQLLVARLLLRTHSHWVN